MIASSSSWTRAQQFERHRAPKLRDNPPHIWGYFSQRSGPRTIRRLEVLRMTNKADDTDCFWETSAESVYRLQVR
ncbi:hypothetical protein Pyn_19950 [Prunus yedoensis var. nudiflora]|uniref:Uncharacterized protein n=1 Tax=Prunus yedoensis var. nudiflora TaxID=2094558 RepID=A0A314Y3E6_PRUYE|nr:hypothetical protein Pyn_19950 [Prunus yedoensis var. nudiflora]